MVNAEGQASPDLFDKDEPAAPARPLFCETTAFRFIEGEHLGASKFTISDHFDVTVEAAAGMLLKLKRKGRIRAALWKQWYPGDRSKTTPFYVPRNPSRP